MANEHKTIFLSIIAMLLAALVMFVGTVAVSGGVSIVLLKGYVLPLVLSVFTLAVFVGVLFARNKGGDFRFPSRRRG